MGRMGSPARSPYCITKFGVEAFSDCLRYEMQPQGVMVSIVEPGNFIAATNLYSPERIKAIADKMWDELPEIVRKDYGRKYFDEQVSKMETYCNSGSTDTSPVIESVAHALTSTTPYTRYHPMDYYWWLRMQIMTHMPAAISDRLYVYWGLTLLGYPGGKFVLKRALYTLSISPFENFLTSFQSTVF